MVVNTDDTGAGSLRQAILDANAAEGADTITFDIPEQLCGANGVCRIAPLSAMPVITEAVTIDATSQPRWGSAPENVCATAEAPSYMRVEVYAYTTSPAIFDVQSPPPVVIRGFSLRGWYDGDIHVRTAGAHRIQCNHLHVAGPGDALLVPGDSYGIGTVVSGSGEGTIIGTDGDGVDDLAEGNVFAGFFEGVYVNANAFVRIAGNSFCLTADRSASLGGRTGVLVRQSSHHNLVGTDWDGVSDALEGNVAAGCEIGVAIDWQNSGPPMANAVVGNRLGLAGIGNGTGLYLANGVSSLVTDNVLAGNGTAITVAGSGSFAADSVRNCIEGNGAGLLHVGAEPLVFESNWWGDASGPSGSGFAGTGDSISVTGAGSVDATPFATDGCQPTPEPSAVTSFAGAALALGALSRRRRAR